MYLSTPAVWLEYLMVIIFIQIPITSVVLVIITVDFNFLDDLRLT